MQMTQPPAPNGEKPEWDLVKERRKLLPKLEALLEGGLPETVPEKCGLDPSAAAAILAFGFVSPTSIPKAIGDSTRHYTIAQIRGHLGRFGLTEAARTELVEVLDQQLETLTLLGIVERASIKGSYRLHFGPHPSCRFPLLLGEIKNLFTLHATAPNLSESPVLSPVPLPAYTVRELTERECARELSRLDRQIDTLEAGRNAHETITNLARMITELQTHASAPSLISERDKALKQGATSVDEPSDMLTRHFRQVLQALEQVQGEWSRDRSAGAELLTGVTPLLFTRDSEILKNELHTGTLSRRSLCSIATRAAIKLSASLPIERTLELLGESRTPLVSSLNIIRDRVRRLTDEGTPASQAATAAGGLSSTLQSLRLPQDYSLGSWRGRGAVEWGERELPRWSALVTDGTFVGLPYLIASTLFDVRSEREEFLS
jgi:hypothetical protein